MKIRIIALVSMLAVGASVASAQAPVKDKGKEKGSEVKGEKDKAKWGKQDGHKARRDDDRDDDRDEGRGRMGSWGSQRRLMGGIQLTDAQKTSIKAIHKNYEPRMNAIRDTLRTNRKADAPAATMDPIRARAVALAAQERSEIRAVLTPEQQVRFDQNVAKFEDRSKDRGKRGGRGR